MLMRKIALQQCKQ